MKTSTLHQIVEVLGSAGKSRLVAVVSGQEEPKEPDGKIPELRKQVIQYFSNPEAKIDDPSIHAFAEQQKIEHSKFEEEIYRTLHDFLSQGKFVKSGGKADIDRGQLDDGVKVEMEHTSCPLIAGVIAKDHLAEIKDYYTRLNVMESEAKKEQGK